MSNLTGGRTNQKLRTHLALVEAAAQLVREGKTFTVAEAADRARVGRTTAYRYFPSVETLVVHASLYAVTEVEKQSIGAALESKTSADNRLRAVIEASDQSIADHEYLYRTMLRISLNAETSEEGELPRRSNVRKEVLDSAIGALRKQLGEKHYERLTAALSLFLGIEAAVVMRDVCMLPPEKARDVKVWGASLILEGALREAARSARSRSNEKPARSSSGKKQPAAASEARR
jgi:AcrR family transcriptional regulator